MGLYSSHLFDLLVCEFRYSNLNSFRYLKDSAQNIVIACGFTSNAAKRKLSVPLLQRAVPSECTPQAQINIF